MKAVLAKHGLRPPVNDLWGPGGTAYLNGLELDDGYHIRVESLRDLVEHCNREVAMLERVIHQRLRDDAGYRAIQAIDGVGPVLAAIFVAEIGDVTRFPNPEALCSWAGLTPKHRESDTKAHRGRITNRARCWCAGAPSRRHRRPRRAQAQGRLPTHRRPAGHPHRPGGGGPQAPHPRLLRPARRRDPLPRPGRRGGVSRIGHSQDASSANGMTPTRGAVG